MLRFGKFPVDKQVFYRTDRSFALVNLKPLLPYHVLVCPTRVVSRFKDLSTEEVVDLFTTVQKVGRVVENLAGGDGLNIAIQDGPLAGQSVPHVHCHVIPRKPNDLNADEIYRLLESPDADQEKQFELKKKMYGRFPAPDTDDDRRPRTDDEMQAEARKLAQYFHGKS